MRTTFRQGIISCPSNFLKYEVSNKTWSLNLQSKSLLLTVAHRGTDYLFREFKDITSAWTNLSSGFTPGQDYWLYWDFSLRDFTRTFGSTTYEPVVQGNEPGNSDAAITSINESSSPNTASFFVSGKYVLYPGRLIVVKDADGIPDINGTYTVISSTYHSSTASTEIFVEEAVPVDTVSGSPSSGGTIAFDLDSLGNPMKVNGRMWFDAVNEIHYVWQTNRWAEVLRVFAGRVRTGTATGMCSNAATAFTGTQIGSNSSVYTGYPIFTDVGAPIKMSDRVRFFTTESDLYAQNTNFNSARIESNIHIAQASLTLPAFNIVAYSSNGKIRTAVYDDIGNTVIGVLLETTAINETGPVEIQGTVTNPTWNWTGYIGEPLWVDNGILVADDPHVTDPISYPQGRVPVARVLEHDTVIFEQGLGGKGDKGDRGLTGETSELATGDTYGLVRLSYAASPFSESPADPVVLSMDDPLLATLMSHIIYNATDLFLVMDSELETCLNPSSPVNVSLQEAIELLCEKIGALDANDISVTDSLMCFSPQPSTVQEALEDICDSIDSIEGSIDSIESEIDGLVASDLPIDSPPESCFATATNVQEALEQMCTTITGLDAGDISITDSITCFSPQPANLQEALEDICDLIENVDVGEITADNVNINGSLTCFSPQPTNVQEALEDLCNLIEFGPSGSVSADDVTVDASGTCFPSASSVQDALEDICDVISGLDASDIAITDSVTCFSPQPANLQEALEDICDLIENVDVGELTADNITFTGPITCFSPQPDNLQEALEDICTMLDNVDVGEITASDVVINEAITCFSPQPANLQEALEDICTMLDNVDVGEITASDVVINEAITCFSPQPANLQEALEDICALIETGSSEGVSAANVSVDASGTCFSTADNAQEALEDICDVISGLDASDIAITESLTCFSPQPSNLQEALEDICDMLGEPGVIDGGSF